MSDFDSARRAALMQDLLRLMKGLPADLLPFEEVRERLRLKQIVDRGIQEVPLDRIIGSVGREGKFNRAFLPRDESLRERWEEVRSVAESQEGFPSIELYYVNDVYFVVDGHHRVSVERRLGASTIEARIKEFLSPMALTSDTSLEEVILKAGLADFLQTAGITQQNPEDFHTTIPNGYERLLDHISVHRYYLGIERNQPVSWDEGVQSWLDHVYNPMIATIRASKILEEFPENTETDLYLFTMDHLHQLRELYGSQTRPDRAVRHFVLRHRAEKSLLKRISLWFHELLKK